RLDVGQQWAMVAQLRARLLRDRPLEVRALNVCGAIALEGGGINEATYFFTRAQEEAMRDNDMATVGRCANNLGIIANMQGAYVLETEDRRILAVALSIAGKTQDAEQMLREVIDRATEHKRPLLVAIAQRDLAHILALQGEVAAAKQLAQAARAAFDRLGAKVEIEKLEALLAIPTSGASELDRSQPGTPPPPLNRHAGARTRGPCHDTRASGDAGPPSS